MDWGNAIIKEIKMENGVITELVGELHLEGSVKTTKLKTTWLADIEELVPLSLVEFDYLISKKKVSSLFGSTTAYDISLRWTVLLIPFCVLVIISLLPKVDKLEITH
jgi:hypothetical protein